MFRGPILENQTKKDMEHQMETGLERDIWQFL